MNCEPLFKNKCFCNENAPHIIVPTTLGFWASLTPIPERQSLQCWNHSFPHPSVHRTLYCCCCYRFPFFKYKSKNYKTNCAIDIFSHRESGLYFFSVYHQCARVINVKMIDQFFNWCVLVLVAIGNITGMGYELANIVIFVIIQPALILLFFVLWRREKRKNKK